MTTTLLPKIPKTINDLPIPIYQPFKDFTIRLNPIIDNSHYEITWHRSYYGNPPKYRQISGIFKRVRDWPDITQISRKSAIQCFQALTIFDLTRQYNIYPSLTNEQRWKKIKDVFLNTQ